MKPEIQQSIFLFLVGTSVLNLLIAIAARVKTKATQFNLLVVYWLSLFVNYFAAAFLDKNETLIAFAYFFQFLPSILVVKMLKDSIGEKINARFYAISWCIGALLSSYLITQTNVGFTISLVPVTLASTMVFFKVIWITLVTKRATTNWIEKGMALVTISGIINHWNYALFRLDESTAWWGWSASIAQYQCLSIFLPLLINHQRAETEKKNIQQALDKLTGSHTIIPQDNIDELYRNLEYEIHQREILTNKLQRTNETLKEEQEMNEILIKTISHDLANPLTVVNAYIDMMLSGRIGPDDYKSTIVKIQNGSNVALDMISRIRDAIVSRNQASLVNLHSVSVDRSIKKLLESFEGKLSAKDIKIRYENNVPLDTFVCAEENALIAHVFSNILSNAIKFSHPQSTITITANERHDHVEIKFIDTGVGISRQRLRERKLLLSTEGTAGEQGTGFGFMIMSYFLRKFGGTFSLESEGENKGTVATIFLKKSSEETDNIKAQFSDANFLS